MIDPHEDLVEAVAIAAGCSIGTARSVIALIAQLRARIAELEKELDSARAEGVAAERERCAKIADEQLKRWPGMSIAASIARSIREAKP